MEYFTVSLLNGVIYGLLLFMVSAGLTLIFGMMGVLNFAHASFYMIDVYKRQALGYAELDKAKQAFLAKARQTPELGPAFSSYEINVDVYKRQGLFRQRHARLAGRTRARQRMAGFRMVGVHQRQLDAVAAVALRRVQRAAMEEH